jgi:pimeloyl-ACP methyl ester carboxylesterase
MRLAGASEQNIARARNSSIWPGLEAMSRTLAYDAACLAHGQLPTDRLAQIRQPTLVATGGRDDLFERAADAIAASLPQRGTSEP